MSHQLLQMNISIQTNIDIASKHIFYQYNQEIVLCTSCSSSSSEVQPQGVLEHCQTELDLVHASSLDGAPVLQNQLLSSCKHFDIALSPSANLSAKADST